MEPLVMRILLMLRQMLVLVRMLLPAALARRVDGGRNDLGYVDNIAHRRGGDDLFRRHLAAAG